MSHDEARLMKLLAAALLLETLRSEINQAAKKFSRRSTQHVCQHTGEGEDACLPCSTFGTLPEPRHVTVIGPDRRSASHFARFWNSVSRLSFASTASEEATEAITRGLAHV